MERLAEEAVECAPFSGKGIVLGEGCAVLVLEDERHAQERGARVLAEVCGYGTCFWPEDGGGDEAWQGRAAAIRNALTAAEVQPGEIDCVFASANGDPEGDRREACALRDAAPAAPLVPVKAGLGETHSASGALQAAACVMAMNEQSFPGLLGQRKPGPLRTALINCFSTSASTPASGSLVLRAA
jgi:3-oxoacyl-(acyl-carrier-protein) synthase